MVTFGVALPHYDLSTPGTDQVTAAEIAHAAQTAERLGFTTGWVSDHFMLPTSRYGLDRGDTQALDGWLALTTAAMATTTLRVGTLVLCEAFRPAGVLAKMAATLDLLTGGRLDLGLGAGWHEPEYAAYGFDFHRPGERLRRLEEYAQVVRAMLTESPVTAGGARHHVADAWCVPGPVQQPHPPIWVGGSGDQLLRVVARGADGWNICWRVSPEKFRERSATLDRACEEVGRDPGTVRRSVGLYCLVGRDDAELRTRFEQLASTTPGWPATLEHYAEDALVGTTAEVEDRIATFVELGAEHIVLTPGPMPYSWPGDWWAESTAHLLHLHS